MQSGPAVVDAAERIAVANSVDRMAARKTTKIFAAQALGSPKMVAVLYSLPVDGGGPRHPWASVISDLVSGIRENSREVTSSRH